MKSESRRRNASSENASARWNRSFDCKLRFTQNDLNRSFTRRVQLKKQTSIGTKFVTTPCKSNLNKENLAVLFANIKKRLSTAHEPLSPKQWPDRPTDDSFQQSLKKLHQNTLQCESGKLPKHMEHDDQSYFFYHMFCLERSRPLPRSFIDHQKDFSVDNRSNLVNWLIQRHAEFKLQQETLFLSISLLDRFVQQVMIKPEDMYNVASVALLLAHKMEDAVSWSPNRIRERCGLLLPLQQFLALERQMLQIFDFQLNFPTALCFLRRFSQVSSFSRRPLHLLAKYLIEKCQLSSECASWLPSVLAAACLYVSARVLLLDSNGWNGHLEYYSGYTLQQVRYFAVKVACFLKISDNWVLNATNLKYSSKENMNVATCCELRRFINCFDPSSLL